MKRLYWQPPGVTRRASLVILLVAAACVAAVERWPRTRERPAHAEKLAAAALAQRGMRAIRAEKERLGIDVDRSVDRAGSGMIGAALTPVTSNPGYLSAKRTSANPNFAAVVVDMLAELGVARGDLAAVGMSGSFPALNIAVLAALDALGVQAIAISSASASQWGATDVALTWLDMERVLRGAGVFHQRSVAASRGGVEDRGYGMSRDGLAVIDAAIARSGAQPLAPASLADAIEQRLAVYDRAAGGRRLRVYVNVGGGTASVGTHVGKRQLPSGLNRALPEPRDRLRDSVMVRFLERGVPVIHLSGIADLARRYGLPVDPADPPALGQGSVYVESGRDPRLAGLGLALIFATILGLVRFELGARWLGRGSPRDASETDEPL